jgi:hypothetical protein
MVRHAPLGHGPRQGIEDVLALELTAHFDSEALPAVFVNEGQHLQGHSIISAVGHEIPPAITTLVQFVSTTSTSLRVHRTTPVHSSRAHRSSLRLLPAPSRRGRQLPLDAPPEGINMRLMSRILLLVTLLLAVPASFAQARCGQATPINWTLILTAVATSHPHPSTPGWATRF